MLQDYCPKCRCFVVAYIGTFVHPDSHETKTAKQCQACNTMTYPKEDRLEEKGGIR